MTTELTLLADKILAARQSSDIFGPLAGTPDTQMQRAETTYKVLVKAVHPDRHQGDDQAQATDAFQALMHWWQMAKEQIANGTYGQSTFTVRTKLHTYTISRLLYSGDLADLYQGTYTDDDEPTQAVLLKMVHDARDNDLLQHEAKILRKLCEPSRMVAWHFQAYLPMLIETVTLTDQPKSRARVANLFMRPLDYVSLDKLQHAYPGGIDPRDAAWMWNRALEILGYVHRQGIVHGAVLPCHVLVNLETHGAMLWDWTAAALNGASLKYRSTVYEAWYPGEVKTAVPATDLYLSTMCVVALLGGDTSPKKIPSTVPELLQVLLTQCLERDVKRRPQDAWELRDAHAAVLKRLYGPPTFRRLTMPII